MFKRLIDKFKLPDPVTVFASSYYFATSYLAGYLWIYLQSVSGSSELVVGSLASLRSMAGLAGNLLVGYVIYYLRRLKVFSLTTLVLSFSILAYAFTRNLTVVTSLTLVENFITVIVSILVYRLVTTLSSPNERSACSAFLRL